MSDKIKITKNTFLQFEEVRISGFTNMWDTKNICNLTTLTRDEVNYIRQNYGKLAKKYL